MDIRKLVLKRLKRLKRSRYWLANQPGLSCRPETVYRWLRGDQDLTSGYLGEVLNCLDMRITSPRQSERVKVR